MPRPKPPEKLIPITLRYPRRTIRKIQELGRDVVVQLISNYRPHESPAARAAARDHRNAAIQRDPRPSKELISEYKLSRQQINNIRRQNR